jgi:hypothetical protein
VRRVGFKICHYLLNDVNSEVTDRINIGLFNAIEIHLRVKIERIETIPEHAVRRELYGRYDQ